MPQVRASAGGPPPGGVHPAPVIGALPPRTAPLPRPSGSTEPEDVARTSSTLERYDFHSHTFLTDGEAAPADMWHHAVLLGHRALAITDHLYAEDPRPMVERLLREQADFEVAGFTTLVGVELSMRPPRKIEATAKAARRAGAQIVIVHGETPVEPVPAGTNHVAVGCNEIDVLAHPGILTEEDAALAKAHDVVLELTPRRGHSWGNGIVATRGLRAGARLVVDSDAHAPEQLLRQEFARKVALGAGVPPSEVARILTETPQWLVQKCRP